MATRPLGGVLAPIAALYGADGELDLDNYAKNVEWYANSPLDGIVVMGSNGESALLDEDEKLRLIDTATRTIGGRKLVLAGTGVESTRATIRLTRSAAELGADFALVVTPHYYRPRYDAEAYKRHYYAVADASPIPIVVYIMTAYTGVDLPASTVSMLSAHPNIVGVKDSAGNAVKFAEMVAGADDEFAVLAGSANFLYPALCLGAKGGILALADVVPAACVELRELFEAGNHEAARRAQFNLLAPNAAVTTRFGIAGLKAAMALVGLETGDPRPPLLPATDAERFEIQRIFEQAGLLARV
ncbi:MAG TPA: dihydrodipicolinate synthase family protein [Thermomicrobiales bacterium]|jgi:4-hydroxy-2-oxoglutarate aldolase|nr:dihydrodipicolinate synthase family protein [Chloroflexota bacterium]HCG30231.1 dihydrodipicolinate synthase family protein [Chloroflexota bacterium]HQX63255.1 dihydrodipicolinate synthase family protein [Thermomicrobiales bacterium]HQZ90333.1 dihydrodipicolinate synthase family protein [Thermomicrobiales bacterium]HRA30755.1 dihydrodipicolinate synthase family protein [Thermomicrobiales bacterium]